MTERVKTWKILVCVAVFSGGTTLFLEAQAPAPIGAASDQAAAAALDLLNSGKLPDAEQAYTQLLAQYPTAGIAPEATFRLGYVQYMRQEYDQAIQTLQKIVSPPATPEIKEAADALVPQIMAAQAASLAATDPNRKKGLDEAIKQFDAFVGKYPKSSQLETAKYGRAMASFQNQDYQSAETALKDNLQHYPNNDSVLQNEDLLGVVLTAEAADLTKNGDKEGANAKFKEAIQYLADIIEKHADVVLANDAQFQIGEVLFNRGAAGEGDKRTADLTHAIDAYRAVQPQDAMVAAQQARVDASLLAVRRASVGRNQAALQEAQAQQDKENAKLAAVKEAPDQTFNAQLRIASCYFQLQKYDEARTLLKFLQPFADKLDQPDTKKQVLYYTIMSYASQGLMSQAEAGYDSFASAFGTDPMGENLPLVMGTAFLTAGLPDKAVYYFQQERQRYPNSPLVNEALNEQAAALVKQKKYADAIATYQQFLNTKPPAEQAATADQGIATIYQQTGKLPDAVKQYQHVADTYPGTAMAEQCAFYSAALEASVDIKASLPKLQAFVTKFPDGKFTAQAMMTIAEVQGAVGDSAGAMQTYKDLVAKFPQSDLAQTASLQEAAILAKAGKTDEMLGALRDFIKAYPQSKDIYYAYDTIGQTQIGRGQMTDAIATYTEMADQHADNPMAAAALYRTAELWRQNAVSQGRYQSLNDQQKAAWTKSVDSSISAAETVLAKFPASQQLGLALRTVLADQQMEVDAGTKTRDQIAAYFHGLAAKYASDASVQSRINFTLAAFIYETDQMQGLADLTAAYKPSLVYAPADMDLYGSALLSQDKPEDAFKVYQKIAQDYPLPANATPAQAPPAIQDAQATALFGMASAMDKSGRTDESGKLFSQLKAQYPWSPKVIEANYGIAKSLVDQKKYPDASKLLVGIVASRTATADLRAHAFLLVGDIQAASGQIPAAIDSYLKTAAFYAGVADAASQGLWRGGQMLEKQAETLNETSTPKKSEQIGKAVTAYKNIVTKYPDSPLVPQAEDRLKALGT